MTAPPNDLRLYELFVLYWDNALNSADREELERCLAASPEAREWFQVFTMQAVAAAELPAPVCSAREDVSEIPSSLDATPEPRTCVTLPAAPIIQKEKKRRWTRRQALQYFGGGVAAGLGGVALGRWILNDSTTAGPRLWNPQGTVVVQDMHGRTVSAINSVPPGGTVSTYGLASSVVLTYSDGAKITLTGDSAVRVIDQNRQVRLHRGAISAAVPPQSVGSDPLTLTTSQVTFGGLSGVLMTLGEHVRATEALIHQGTATATHPTGEPLVVVQEGESLTVWPGGDHKKKPIPRTPEEYSWDLSKPFPEGWVIGQLDSTPEGLPIARPESWPDPYYHNTEMYQIRSNKQWLHGFFQLTPASVIRVRYRVDEPGEGQLCFCVRSTQSRSPQTGMLEWSGTYGDKGINEWQWLEIKAEDMLKAPNKHTPKFGAPWIGFLFIFNTYTKDLGLEIAEFRVTRGGAANPGV